VVEERRGGEAESRFEWEKRKSNIKLKERE
jgi:hypothetical protein